MTNHQTFDYKAGLLSLYDAFHEKGVTSIANFLNNSELRPLSSFEAIAHGRSEREEWALEKAIEKLSQGLYPAIDLHDLEKIASPDLSASEILALFRHQPMARRHPFGRRVVISDPGPLALYEEQSVDKRELTLTMRSTS